MYIVHYSVYISSTISDKTSFIINNNIYNFFLKLENSIWREIHYYTVKA